MADDGGLAQELFNALAVSTGFLAVEAAAHRERGDKDKAASCEGQADLNYALLRKAEPILAKQVSA